MEEIITKDNLNTYTQGLKGVLSSMGLEIDDKAGSSAVSAVGAKVDTVDDKCDLILTAVGSGSGDVDYSQFVTKEYLEYALAPHFHFNVRRLCYFLFSSYYSGRNSKTILLADFEPLPKLTYLGTTLDGNDGNNKIIYNAVYPYDATSSYTSDSASLPLDENYNAVIPSFLYRYYLGLDMGASSSSVYVNCYKNSSNPYGGTLKGISNMNITDISSGYLCIGYKKQIIIKKDGEETNDIYVSLNGVLYKNKDYIYTKKILPASSYLKIKAQEISGYDCVISDICNYVVVQYYPVLSIYQDTVRFSKDFGLYCGESTSTDTELSASVAFDVIMKNTHLYAGTYENGTMSIKLIKYGCLDKYVDGTNVVNNISTHILIKFPEFYAKFTGNYQVDFYIDLNAQTQPSGEGWHKYGDSLIGVYASSVSNCNSAKNYGRSTYPSNWESLYQSNSNFSGIGLKEFAMLRIIYRSKQYIKFLDGTDRSSLFDTETESHKHFISDFYVTKNGSYLQYGGALTGVISNLSNNLPTSTNKYISAAYPQDGFGNISPAGGSWTNSSSSKSYQYYDGDTVPAKLYICLPLTLDPDSSNKANVVYAGYSVYSREKYTGPYTIID